VAGAGRLAEEKGATLGAMVAPGGGGMGPPGGGTGPPATVAGDRDVTVGRQWSSVGRGGAGRLIDEEEVGRARRRHRL
jgi:hypothetical protein